MAGIEHGNVTNEEFVEEVARYECVYNPYSKNFNDKNKKANSWEKSAVNLIYVVSSWIFFESKTDVSFGFEADVVVVLGLKKEINFACSKISSSMSAMLFALILPRAQRVSSFDQS